MVIFTDKSALNYGKLKILEDELEELILNASDYFHRKYIKV